MNSLDEFPSELNHLTFGPGEVIFHVGEAGDEVYVVTEGSVDLLDNERPVRTAGPGEVLGEMAVVDGSPRSLTAVAKTACRLVAIDQCRFNFLVRTSPHFARHLRQMIGERLQHSGPLGVGQFPGRSDVAGRIGDALPTSR